MTIKKANGSAWEVLSFKAAFRCGWCGHWKHDGCNVGPHVLCSDCVTKALPGVLEVIARDAPKSQEAAK